MGAPDPWAEFYRRREELRRERLPSRADNPGEFDTLARYIAGAHCTEQHDTLATWCASMFGWQAGELLARAAQL